MQIRLYTIVIRIIMPVETSRCVRAGRFWICRTRIGSSFDTKTTVARSCIQLPRHCYAEYERSRQDGIDKAFVVTSGSSRRLTDILSPPSPAVNISLSLSRGPRLTRRLIDAIRFLRVITVALEPNRFNLPAAI